MAATTDTPPWRKQGALEHSMKFATLNVGLPNDAIEGNRWGTVHRPELIAIFSDLLRGNRKEKVLGLFLCEVGNLKSLFSPESKRRMNDAIKQAFKNAGALEHEEPTIIWADKGVTCAAFAYGVEVDYRNKKDGLVRHQQWRSVEEFLITVALEHKKKKTILIHNTHQPSSGNHSFTQYARISFCKSLFVIAKEYCEQYPDCIGWAVVGDTNCSYSNFDRAFLELIDVREPRGGIRQVFPTDFSATYGVREKGGDIIVAAGRLGFHLVNSRCMVEGREEQHDPMYLEFRYTTRTQEAVAAEPRPPRYNIFTQGAKEHTAIRDREKKEIIKMENTDNEADYEQHKEDMRKTQGAKEHSTASSSSGYPLASHTTERFEQREEEGSEADYGEAVDTDKESDAEWQQVQPEASASDMGALEHKEMLFIADELQAVGLSLLQSTEALPTDVLRQLCDKLVQPSIPDSLEKLRGMARFASAFNGFLTKYPTKGDPPTIDKTFAPARKSQDELRGCWSAIFEYRREAERDDQKPIESISTRRWLHSIWLKDFRRYELTREQKWQKTSSQQVSIFNAYLMNNYGGQHFIMGVWQMGMPWLPSKELLEATDPTGALEHVKKHFTTWIESLAKAFQEHKDAPDTREARDRSNYEYKYGLTPQEKRMKAEKKNVGMTFCGLRNCIRNN